MGFLARDRHLDGGLGRDGGDGLTRRDFLRALGGFGRCGAELGQPARRDDHPVGLCGAEVISAGAAFPDGYPAASFLETLIMEEADNAGVCGGRG